VVAQDTAEEGEEPDDYSATARVERITALDQQRQQQARGAAAGYGTL
jgi:hypothetical protein